MELEHGLQREPQTTAKVAFHWGPDRKRKRGRQRTIWRRKLESEIKVMIQHSWGSLSRLAQDRQRWRDFVAALDTTGCNGS